MFFDKRISKFDSYRIGGECKYEVFKSRKLGTGAYSSVYLGRCLNTYKNKIIGRDDGIVAIKKIEMYKFSLEKQRIFQNEINVLKQIKHLNHPNIVKCFDIVEDMDVTYVIMEYCDGGDLGTLLVKPMRESKVKYYFGQLINALKFLKTNDIIHRDMKPANILLCDKKKTLKICDFGFAKINSSLKRVSTICGSPMYMAPEILNHKSYNNAIDIWALGMILFEMMYGYHPCSECNDINELTQFITNSRIEFPAHMKINKTIGLDGIALLKLLLNPDGVKRIELDQLFEHEWLNGYVTYGDTYSLTNNTINLNTSAPIPIPYATKTSPKSYDKKMAMSLPSHSNQNCFDYYVANSYGDELAHHMLSLNVSTENGDIYVSQGDTNSSDTDTSSNSLTERHSDISNVDNDNIDNLFEETLMFDNM
jgi:serine/threonine protein kinase